MENVLKEGPVVYRTLKPEFDLNLFDGNICHVAEVLIRTDKPKPGEIRISISNDRQTWHKLGKFPPGSDDVTK